MEFKVSLIWISMCVVIYYVQQGATRMTITPQTVEVNGDSDATTISPSYVDIECRGSETSGTVFSITISREDKNIAYISINSNGQGTTSISDDRPDDVPQKSPTLEGVLSGTNSYLRIRYLRNRVDCNDGATYHCTVLYSTQGVHSAREYSATLTVQVTPGPFTLQAYRVQDYGAMPIANMSTVQYDELIQLTCDGSVGTASTSSSVAIIEWYRKTSQLTYGQRYYVANTEESITDGNPIIRDNCYYTRMSTLRYKVTSADDGLAFYCQAQSGSRTGVSGEFRFIYDGSTNGVQKATGSVKLAILVLGMITLWFRS